MGKDRQVINSAELGEINAAMVLRIQQGERELLPELWANIERLTAWYANRLLYKLPSGTIEFDELYNAGYIALVDAVNTYDPARAAFSTHYAMRLKTAFSEALGGRSIRQRKDPIHYALRFEAPIGGEDDDLLLRDSIPDEDAEAALESIEDKVYRQQLHDELETALSNLPEQQESILRRRYYDGETLDAVGVSLHTSRENIRQRENKALRTLQHSSSGPRLWALAYPGERWIDQKTNFYKHSGVNCFNSTGLSDVERLVIMREEWRGMDRSREESSIQEDQELDDILAESERIDEQLFKEMPWLKEQYLQMKAAKPGPLDDDIAGGEA